MNKMLKGCLFGIAVFPMLEPLQAATMAQHRPLNPNLGNEISAQGLSPVFKKPKIEFKEQSIMNQKNENVPQKGETIIQTAPASPQLQEESDSEEEIYDEDGCFLDEELNGIQMSVALARTREQAGSYIQGALEGVDAYLQHHEGSDQAFRTCFDLINGFFISHKNDQTLTSEILETYQGFVKRINPQRAVL